MTQICLGYYYFFFISFFFLLQLKLQFARVFTSHLHLDTNKPGSRVEAWPGPARPGHPGVGDAAINREASKLNRYILSLTTQCR